MLVVLEGVDEFDRDVCKDTLSFDVGRFFFLPNPSDEDEDVNDRQSPLLSICLSGFSSSFLRAASRARAIMASTPSSVLLII